MIKVKDGVKREWLPYPPVVTASRNIVTPKAEDGKLCPTCGKLYVVAKSDADRQRAYRERKKGKA